MYEALWRNQNVPSVVILLLFQCQTADTGNVINANGMVFQMGNWQLGMYYTECPGCGKEIIFSHKGDGYGICVNCESAREVHIPGMLHLWRGCRNPFCKWSAVEAD